MCCEYAGRTNWSRAADQIDEGRVDIDFRESTELSEKAGNSGYSTANPRIFMCIAQSARIHDFMADDRHFLWKTKTYRLGNLGSNHYGK